MIDDDKETWKHAIVAMIISAGIWSMIALGLTA